MLPVHSLPAVLSDRYMLLPIEAGFDWETYFAHIDTGDWYLVVFRCKHRADADEALLTRLDDRASQAAIATPGFIGYFAGVPAATGECLSFCLWEKPAHARSGASQPAHREAAQQGVSSYEYYRLERYQIRKAAGTVSFEALHANAERHAAAAAF
jgi:heme-degrading monooxygenase HmoA